MNAYDNFNIIFYDKGFNLLILECKKCGYEFEYYISDNNDPKCKYCEDESGLEICV